MNTIEQRCLNYMNAYKAPREEFFQHLWDSTVCPKELAQKALTHAGLPFDKIWTHNARIAYNPCSNKDELTLDWITVAYYLVQTNAISLCSTAEAKDRVNQYLASMP